MTPSPDDPRLRRSLLHGKTLRSEHRVLALHTAVCGTTRHGGR